MNLWQHIEFRIYRWFFDPTLQIPELGFYRDRYVARLELEELPVDKRKMVFIRITVYLLAAIILSALIILITNYVY